MFFAPFPAFAVLFISPRFIILIAVFQVLSEFPQPPGDNASHRSQFSAAVLCYHNKAVVVVVKLRFLAIGKHLRYSFPAPSKAALHVLGRNHARHA